MNITVTSAVLSAKLLEEKVVPMGQCEKAGQPDDVPVVVGYADDEDEEDEENKEDVDDLDEDENEELDDEGLDYNWEEVGDEDGDEDSDQDDDEEDDEEEEEEE